MNYTEQVNKAKEISNLMLNGSSDEELREILRTEGYSKWDAAKIFDFALKAIRVKYSDKIKKQMLDGTLESHLDDYDELSAEIFEQIQHEQIASIQRETKKEIVRRFRQGEDLDEIESTVLSDYFTTEQFDEIVSKFEEDKSEISKQKLIGWGAIFLGITLTILSDELMSSGVIIFYGLIIFGLWQLFREYTSHYKRYD